MLCQHPPHHSNQCPRSCAGPGSCLRDRWGLGLCPTPNESSFRGNPLFFCQQHPRAHHSSRLLASLNTPSLVISILSILLHQPSQIQSQRLLAAFSPCTLDLGHSLRRFTGPCTTTLTASTSIPSYYISLSSPPHRRLPETR
jgi:hypothetical protein